MKVDKFLDILNYIVCSILSVSIFLVFIPFLTDLIGLGILSGQAFIIIYLHNALNSKRSYYFFTSLLGVSNLIVCVFSYIVAIKSADSIENIPQTSDILSSVMLQATKYILHYIFAVIFIVTAIVVIECIISMIIKHRYFKKTKTPVASTYIEDSKIESPEIEHTNT